MQFEMVLTTELSNMFVFSGFTIGDDLKAIGVGLNIPPFLTGERTQFTPEEVYETQEISSVRIHVRF